MRVFVTRIIPEIGLRLLEEAGIEVVQWTKKRELAAPELIQYCQNADFLQQCQHLKFVSLFAVGFDNVDIAEASRLKIPVGHNPDVLSKATAELAFLLMQTTGRKAFFHHKRIQKGDWHFFDPTAHLGIDLQGKTLGVFGLGKIGFEMARSCNSTFGMEILYHNRIRNEQAEKQLGARKVSFGELLQNSDVISVHANLSSETKGIFDRSAFAKTKPNAIFINTARCAIHNETDLRHTPENATLWGAGPDVTNPEPMDRDNPLLDMPNVSILPHIGSATKETRDAMAVLAAKNVVAGLRNEPLFKIVNPEVYA